MKDEKQHFFDKKENITLVLRVFYTVCVLLVIGDLVIHRHIAHSWERLFGFYAIFGFVACVVLVIIAKEMRKFLMRDEDYYQDKDEEIKTESKHVDH
ncbi:MAG: hypothetical protein WD709_01350 [Gammaproteobacteria bacterium]